LALALSGFVYTLWLLALALLASGSWLWLFLLWFLALALLALALSALALLALALDSGIFGFWALGFRAILSVGLIKTQENFSKT
jgi:hypothetical protein